MTVYEFGILDIIEQEELLNRHGIFLYTTRNGDFLVDLFNFKDLYVELFYRVSDMGKIASRCFLSIDEITLTSNESLN